MTTPDQGSGTRPRVSDDTARKMIACSAFVEPPSASDGLCAVCLDLLDARATLARYEAALADLVAEAEKVISDHDAWHCDTGTGDLTAAVARARALSSGGSGEAKGREA